MNTGYQQSILAYCVSSPGNLPLDVNGNLCAESGKKQAILLLEGENNPNAAKYEVLRTFKVGEVIDGIETRVYNPELCVATVYDFEANRTALSYGVSKDELGFDFTDQVLVTSSAGGAFAAYTVTSKPTWLTATQSSTSGTVNTLNLVIERNRTHDNLRSGNIVLTQKDTKVSITIAVTQSGRLTEGTPTEYPYVNSESVLDKDYNIAQIGEQVWTQSGVIYDSIGGHAPNQGHLDQWALANPDKYKPTIDEYMSVLGYGYTREGKNGVKNALADKYGDAEIDIHKHQMPLSSDFLQMMGFLAAKAGATSDQNFSLSTFTSLTKKALNLTTDGYDDVRLSYPRTWIDAVDNGKLVFNQVKTGTDKYALGFMTPGIFQPYTPESQYTLLYGALQLHLRDEDPVNTNMINLFGYSINTNINNKGWYWRSNDDSAYSVRGIRTVRYRALDYDIYDNGSEIRKIANGDTPPNGFTVVPKGIKRGIWFANPNLTYDQMGVLHYYIHINTGNLSNSIG